MEGSDCGAGIEGKIWKPSFCGANQRKSTVFLPQLTLNYDINNENTNTFINVNLQSSCLVRLPVSKHPELEFAPQ